MKHLFYFLLLQLFVIQTTTAQTDPNPPAVKYNSFSNQAIYKIEKAPAPAFTVGTISGFIRDKNGVPLVNANVICGQYSAYTNEYGEYRITNVRKGRYTITVQMPRAPVEDNGSDNDSYASGPSDQFSTPDYGPPLNPRFPKVEVGPQNPNVVQNFEWFR